MVRIDRFARQLVLLAFCIALLAAPSVAFGDAEPNDGITQTEEPLAGGQVYSGTQFSENDEDWYAFNVASQTQLDVAVTTPGDSPCDVDMVLRDADGGYVTETSPDQNETGHILYTTPTGTTRFILQVRNGCAGTKYQFRLDPSAAIVDGPRRGGVTPTGESNQNPFQAGQLAGGQQYSGSIDTENDEDWFFFYSRAAAFDVAVTSTAGCHSIVQLYEEGHENEVASASPDVNETEHIRLTPPGPRRYFLKFTGCIGTKYQFRVDPPSAVASGPEPQSQDPPLPTMTFSAANSYVGQALRSKYGRRFTRRRGGSYSYSCRRASDSWFRCSVKWKYKKYRYSGKVDVYYFRDAGQVYWTADFYIKRRR